MFCGYYQNQQIVTVSTGSQSAVRTKPTTSSYVRSKHVHFLLKQ